MRLGISISVGPVKVWLGTSRCRLSIGRLGRPCRKLPRDSVKASTPKLKVRHNGVAISAPDTHRQENCTDPCRAEGKPTQIKAESGGVQPFQLDPQARQDSKPSKYPSKCEQNLQPRLAL
jgi:hypothetical protein